MNYGETTTATGNMMMVTQSLDANSFKINASRSTNNLHEAGSVGALTNESDSTPFQQDKENAWATTTVGGGKPNTMLMSMSQSTFMRPENQITLE